MAAVFEARYPGRCGVCDEAIRVDELVTYVDDQLAHHECPTVTAAATPDPCPSCWTVPAANGACGCDA